MVNVFSKCAEILRIFAEGVPLLWQSLLETTLGDLLNIPDYAITVDWVNALLNYPAVAIICGVGLPVVVSISLVRWVLGVGK